MKVVATRGLLFYNKATKENMMDCPEADAIAQANDLLYAERVVSKYDGKTLTIDDATKKIISEAPATSRELGNNE